MLYIITSVSISSKAKNYISNFLSKGGYYGNIRFIDGEQIVSLIERFFPDLFDIWFGTQTNAYFRETGRGGVYPNITVYLKHPQSGKSIPVKADFNTGMEITHVSSEYLQNIGFDFEDAYDLNQNYFLGNYYFFEHLFTISLDGANFKETVLYVVDDWNHSGFVEFYKERVMIVGRDIPSTFRAKIVLDFSNQ